MCQVKKSRAEISRQVYLNKTDIQRLLDVSRDTACRIYDFAKKEDERALGEYIVEPTKVRISSICKVIGMNLNTIRKQAES